MTDNTLDVSQRVIQAVTTQLRIIRRYRTTNIVLMVTLIVIGGCLAVSGYIGFVGVGVAAVIFLLGQAMTGFASLKGANETDLRWYRFELLLLILISLELGYIALTGADNWFWTP